MIDRITAFTLNLLKSNISIVLFFYASGFLSFIAYYRVLGLPFISGSAQAYAEFAGRDIFQILQTFIFLSTKPDYLISIFSNLTWAGFWIYLWLVTIFTSFIIYIIFKSFSHKLLLRHLQQKPVTFQIRLLLIAVAVIAVFHIEIQPFYAVNVLQASNLAEFYQQKQNILNFEKQTNQINYRRRVKIFSQADNDASNKYNSIRNYFFATPEKTYDESGNADRRLNALMLIILIVSITAFVLVIHRQYTSIKWLLLLFVFAQAILIPFNCGILRSKYQYPVISLDYTEKDKPMHKDGVFLLAKSQDSLIIYDRLSFFEISYIPQNSIINMSQIFTTSPFSNCSNGDIKPCEIYAIKQP